MKGHVQTLVAAAPIDDGRRADNASAGHTSHVDSLAGGTASRHDILDDQDSIGGVQGKTAPQRQRAVLPFGKDGANPKRPCDFMTDDNATEGRRQNHAWREAPNAVGDTGTAGLSLARMLQDQGTLQVAGAVEPRRQSEVPVQKRPDAAEQIENIFSSGGRHVASIPFAMGANRARTSVAR